MEQPPGLILYFLLSAKKYRGRLKFGTETDTLDPEGNTVRESSYIPTLNEIKEILPTFIGKQLQTPPLYSALHVDGKRAYQMARKGLDVEMQPREIEISSLDIVSYEGGILEFESKVSKGTYIRSLARDIAYRLNTCGHLVALRRLEVGPFTLEDIGKDTMFLLEKTNLFSTVEMDARQKKNIDNGAQLSSHIISDTDSNKPYCFVFIDNKPYGIGDKGDKFKFLTRF